MIKEISSILKNRLIGAPYVDIIAGVASRVEYQERNADGNPITKRMPVVTDVHMQADCKIKGREVSVVPDSSKKGVIYFEDNGATYTGNGQLGAYSFQAALTLVCWMNRRKIVGDTYQEITTYCIADILKRLQVGKIMNEGNFSRIMVKPGRIMPQDYNVFSRYTYEEAVTQYLRPPFEFFGINLVVTFDIHPSCINALNINPSPC